MKLEIKSLEINERVPLRVLEDLIKEGHIRYSIAHGSLGTKIYIDQFGETVISPKKNDIPKNELFDIKYSIDILPSTKLRTLVVTTERQPYIFHNTSIKELINSHSLIKEIYFQSESTLISVWKKSSQGECKWQK